MSKRDPSKPPPLPKWGQAFVFETLMIAVAGIALAIVLPSMVSAHSDVQLVCAFVLALIWAGWFYNWFYRMSQMTGGK